MAVWVSSLSVRRAHFLVWKWDFWKRSKLSPFGWEFWHDPEWQRFSLISLGLWIPNTVLFGVVVFFVGHGIWPAVAQSATWDIGVYFICRNRLERWQLRKVDVRIGAQKRLAATCVSFVYHKLLVFLVIADLAGDGTKGLIIARIVQAIIGILENPLVWFYNDFVVFGQLRVRDVPRALARAALREIDLVRFRFRVAAMAKTCRVIPETVLA